MQVILLQDVANVGKKFQEVEVANGYGTNYLIPNGFAQVATDETRSRYQKQQEEAEAERQKEREVLASAVEKIDGGNITITVANAGGQGQLFAGIHPKDIAAAINEEFDIDITGADIDRDQPISKVGEEEITLSILETTVTITVEVTADNITVETADKADVNDEVDNEEMDSAGDLDDETENEEE